MISKYMPKSKCCNSEYLAVYSNTGETEYVCYACDHVCDITNPTPPTSTVEDVLLAVHNHGKNGDVIAGSHRPYLSPEKATQAIIHLIQEAELQARANAYYEAADLFSDRPEIYKIFWDKRQEVLAQLKGGKDNE